MAAILVQRRRHHCREDFRDGGAALLVQRRPRQWPPHARAQISTFAPSSTTRLLGRFKKSAAADALVSGEQFLRPAPAFKAGLTMSQLK
jgi:hypothetical protein